jgi:hypothetical protein
MKTSRLLLMVALVGFFLFSCEELELKPDLRHDASLKFSEADKSTASARIASESMDVIDFESYSAGTIPSEVSSKSGAGPVKVTGYNPRVPDRNAAMIFDSAVPTGGDPDLGTPHKDFGGPGIGVGGQKGAQYENNTALGKVLIITEDFDSSDPDDADLRGSYFDLDFSALGSVSIYSMHIMDVEVVENTATVSFYDKDGNTIGGTFGLPKVGDNGVYNYVFGEGVSGVSKMHVNINGSGAIDNIVFLAEQVDNPPPPPSEQGCTATVGYWKNHTKYSAAKRDATWDKIGAQAEDTPFFLSGKSYLDVLKTPTKGNAYYILAYQYIAATLNVLRGASAPDDVMNALAESQKLFEQYKPGQIAAMKASNPVRQQFIEYGALLDKYNNGKTGPGHCD